MRKLSSRATFLVATLLYVFLSPAASANSIRLGLQIGRFSPQDWTIQNRFEDGDRPYEDGFPYYAYSGFGDGFELKLNVQYNLDLWGLRLDLARRSMSDDAILYDFFSSYDWHGEMEVYVVKSFLIHRIYGKTGRISPFLGVGTGVYFADFEVTLTDRFYRDPSPSVRKGSSTPVALSFLAGFEYAVVGNIFLDCELEYDFAESDWTIEWPNSDSESEVRNLNIGGTTIRLGLGYGF